MAGESVSKTDCGGFDAHAPCKTTHLRFEPGCQIHNERFIAGDPRAVYDIVVTTDAQTHTGHTKFVSFIVVYRVGRGAWLCSRQVILPREIRSVQEKLSLETTFSQEIAAQFGYAEQDRLVTIIFPYLDQGADIRFMVDIDGGTGIRNKTAACIAEMVGRIEAMGLIARVKPESVMVSVADRETKKPYRLQAVSS